MADENKINMRNSEHSVIVSGDNNVIHVNQPTPSSSETPEMPPPPTDRKKMPPPCQMMQRHRMPYRSIGKSFVGKIGEIWQLHDILQGNKKVAVIDGVGLVVGMGGLGKTQLAIEYAHRFAMCYPGGIFWVYAEQGFFTVPSQILFGAREISVDPKASPKDQLNQIWTSLSQSGQPVLIIYDNFSENEALQSWLPHSSVISVLVTTRRRDLSKYSPVELQTLSPEEGIELLNARAGKRKFGEEAEKLIEALGGLPLAIEIMGHVLQQRPDISIDKLLAEMKRLGEVNIIDNFAKKYKDQLPSGHAKEIAATVQMSWNLASPMAKTVLQVMSCLAPAPVPRRLIRKILANRSDKKGFWRFLKGIFKRKAVDAKDLITIDEAIWELVGLSLADTDQDADPAAHRLIRSFAKLTIEKNSDLPQKTVNAVLEEMKRIENDYDTAAYRGLEKIEIHARKLLSEGFKEAHNYLYWYHRKSGNYQLAAEYGRESLKMAEEWFEPENPEIAKRQSNLGSVLKELGQYEEAGYLLIQSLDSYRKILEPNHPDLIVYKSELASVLQDLGQYKEARDLFIEALESAKKNFKPGHRNIAALQANLALVLRDLGKYKEAAELLRQALESDKKNFEPGHPTIAALQSNLATVLKALGEYESAAQLLRQALESEKKNFEPGHPTIARTQSNLALVLQDLGKYQEAAQLLRQALESDKKNFEPGHPTIAICQSNLALVLQNLGKYEEAAELLRQALESDKKNFEPDHPEIAKKQSNLATVLKDLGEYEEAAQLLRQALESDKRNFEQGHPNIASKQSNLASVLKGIGKYEEAAHLLRQALESDKKNFEPGHPTIARCQSNLATVLQNLGEYGEAAQLLKPALEIWKKIFEPNHPHIAIAQSNLASVLYHLKEYEEAQELLQQAYNSLLNKLGADHPHTKNVQAGLKIVIEARGLNQD